MRTHVALLRGINVGGRNRVAMVDLRDVVKSLGHSDVATYIQSGNVVFSSSEQDTTALAAALERGIAERLSVKPRVVVLPGAELAAVVAANPFPDESDGKRLHAVFRMGALAPEEIERLDTAQQRALDKGSRDELIAVERTVYLRTPDGLGRSVLAAELAGSGRAEAAGSPVTVRNWTTVTKLLDLLG